MSAHKYFNYQSDVTIILMILFFSVVTALNSSCGNKNQNEAISIAASPALPPQQEPKTDSELPYEVADQLPVFPGGTDSLLKYIFNNIEYPETAKLKGVQGTVVVRFAVEADCSIDRVSILRGVDADLDKEAIRVISTLPEFEKPGYKDNKPVAVWHSIPINFALD